MDSLKVGCHLCTSFRDDLTLHPPLPGYYYMYVLLYYVVVLFGRTLAARAFADDARPSMSAARRDDSAPTVVLRLLS